MVQRGRDLELYIPWSRPKTCPTTWKLADIQRSATAALKLPEALIGARWR